MGLDATIYFKAKPGFMGGPLEPPLPIGFVAVPIPEYCSEQYPDATHEVQSVARYYGEGYERGPWPQIAAALMILIANESVERVWYGSDSAGPQEIQPEDVLNLCRHYMANGHRPYFST